MVQDGVGSGDEAGEVVLGGEVAGALHPVVAGFLLPLADEPPSVLEPGARHRPDGADTRLDGFGERVIAAGLVVAAEQGLEPGTQPGDAAEQRHRGEHVLLSPRLDPLEHDLGAAPVCWRLIAASDHRAADVIHSTLSAIGSPSGRAASTQARASASRPASARASATSAR